MSTTVDDESDKIHVIADVITTGSTADEEDDADKGVAGEATRQAGSRVDVGAAPGGEAGSDDEDATYARTVVVGVDGSAQSYHAFHWYLTNMHMDGNYIILVHAFELPLLHSFQEMYVSPDMWQATLKREARHTTNMEKRLSGVLNRCKIPGRFEARGGRAGDVLVAVAEETEADVVVVGTRGHGKLRRAVMGSVSGHVTRHAPCPVMVCRQKGRLRTQSSGSRASVGSSVRQRNDSTNSQGSQSSQSSRVRFDMSTEQCGARRRPRYHSTGSMTAVAEQVENKKPPEKLFKSILSRRRNKSECDVSTVVEAGCVGESGADRQRMTPTETATRDA